MSTKSHIRNRKGVTTVALILTIAFCVLLPLGLLSFELLRLSLIQTQLQSVTDAAALAGTAAMASAPSAPSINPSTNAQYTFNDREYIAMTVAAEQFAQNTILQTTLSLNNIPASSDGTGGWVNPASGPYNVNANMNPQPPQYQSPAVHSALLNIILLNSSNQQVALGTTATSIQVQAYYSDAPIFLGVVCGGWNIAGNLGNSCTYTLSAIANGGLPSIDLMLCFDTSGSMDDQTSCTLVERYWNGTNPSWNVVKHAATLFNLFDVPDTGTQVNLFFPQNLSYGAYPAEKTGKTITSGNGNQYVFTETPSSTGQNPNASVLNGLRAANASTLQSEMTAAGRTYGNYTTSTLPEAGLPPGNWDPRYPATETGVTNSGQNGNGLNPTVISNAFTDLVAVPSSYSLTVNNMINGVSTAFVFQDIEQLVEASHGNCESSGALNQALCQQYGSTSATRVTDFKTFTPKTGYYNAYWLFVLQNASPISSAQAAAYDFFNTMHLSANSHFGLETFAGCAATTNGSSNGDTSIAISGSGQNEVLGPINNIDPNYLPNYQSTFALPCIAVSQSSDNYNLITGSFIQSAYTQYPPSANPYATLTSNLPLLPTTSTDISDALNQALTIMTSSTYVRSTANKAIILFTDGIPNEPTSTSVGYADAISEAQQAGAASPVVPIYTIGLSQNTTILPQENNLLGDGQGSNPQGIAYYSAPNVATYYSVTNPANLNTAFQQIARSLCVLTVN
jgi:hypothetical protein